MNSLKVLVMMQLKEKLNLSFLKDKKQVLFKAIFTILKFALVIMLCYALLFVCRLLNLFSLTAHIPTSVINVVFTVMLILSIISCTFGLVKSLYSSRDNQVLLTLPTKSIYVFLSKLIVFYLYELIKNLSFMIPLFISYGIISGFSVIYYFWIIFCFIFISLIPVLTGALLSIPMLYIIQFFKQYKILQGIVFASIVALLTMGVIKGISLIPENIDFIATWGTTYWKIQDFLKTFSTRLGIFYDITEMLVGIRLALKNVLFTTSSLLTFLKVIGYLIIVLGLTLLITKPLFYKMASKPFEYLKKDIKNKPKNKVRNKYYSSLRNEFLLNIRSTDAIFNNLIILIGLPIGILLLNKIFAAMDTRTLGNYLTLSFNILIVLLFILSSNSFAASIYSKEGRASYLLKVQPSRYQPLLISKLVFNGIVAIISLIATGVVIKLSTNLSVSNVIILTLFFIFIYIAHLCWSAELDIMNPQYEIYASIGEQESNPNETKSTIYAFLLAFGLFAIALFLMMENINEAWYRLLFISLLLLILRVYLFLNKIKLYYKEK